MRRSIIHVDMDAFFASVEVRERPELAGRPLIVGGTPEGRGVVAAASYEVRRFGVHSAMPTAVALRLCPDAVVVPARHALYAEVSGHIRAIFERYTPLIEPLSLDEAFLDVTHSRRLFGAAEDLGRRIKREIRGELGLTASVGVAPNKFLAKLASDLEKPDGLVVVHPGSVQDLLDPLPVTRLWGVGPAAERRLERLGIRTVSELRRQAQELLRLQLGGLGDHLWHLARGLDERPVVPERQAKSISHESTFARDISDPAVIRAWLADLSEQVGWRLRRQGLTGRTLTIKVRYADFSTLTRSTTLPEPTDVTAVIRDTAMHLYGTRIPRGHPPLRLLGVGVSGFDNPGAQQPGLFEEGRERHVDSVVDAIRDRFGVAAL
ncbi:MAG: DNA polymerase IV, partial [Chromatiales bacterium]